MNASRRALLLLLAAVSMAVAQQDQPMTSQPGLLASGMASLRVQVFAGNNTFLTTQALVRLHDPREMHEAWDTTHDRSETVFHSLAPGTYEVEVSAAGYHTAVTHVQVFDQPVQYTVQVILKADPGTDVYNAPADAGISGKARKESERGIIDLQRGKTKDAEKDLRKALKEAPQNAQINYLLGVALLRDKRITEAEHFLLQATAFDPHHAQALTALGGLRVEQQDYPAAGKFLEQAIAVNPKQWRAHWLLANARFSQEQFEAAKSEAELAIQLSNDSAPSAHLLMGEALGNLGQYSEAIAALQTYLQQAPAGKDAPGVRKMISEMQQSLQQGGNAGAAQAEPEPVSLSFPKAPVHVVPMLSLMSPVGEPPDIDSVLPPVATGVTCPSAEVLSGAGAGVKLLVDALDSFTATEVQTHEQLDDFGKPFSRSSRKSEYVVAITQTRPGWLNLQELRRDLSGLGPFPDRMATRGLLSLAFVFHPAMQPDYRFDCEGLGEWKGQPTWLIHFRQLPGRSGRLQAFTDGRQVVPVALRGRAWIGAVDFQIVHVEAELVEPAPEIQLLREYEIADYGPVDFVDRKTKLWLPQDSQIYLDIRGHRYRFSDQYTEFKLFSVDTAERAHAGAVPK